ncbi:ICOS ligand isoform X1 [Acipenser ruthenus]|uniref:ICOS ligand isoform X1 n=1 Tax=Acipenser ruthenus TaxID=7906 RepID=UPI0027404F2D|nr:ICOS ligand isoform X1 [Acipenser ruthenus]
MARTRILIRLIFVLPLSLLHSVSSQTVQVSAQVGGAAILPCVAPTLKGVPLESLYISWRLDDRVVFEFEGKSGQSISLLQSPVELPKKAEGDFSLSLHKVTLAEKGTYECYIKEGSKPQNFFQKVILSVSAALPTGSPTETSQSGNVTATTEAPPGNEYSQNATVIALVVILVLLVMLVAAASLWYIRSKREIPARCMCLKKPAEERSPEDEPMRSRGN